MYHIFSILSSVRFFPMLLLLTALIHIEFFNRYWSKKFITNYACFVTTNKSFHCFIITQFLTCFPFTVVSVQAWSSFFTMPTVFYFLLWPPWFLYLYCTVVRKIQKGEVKISKSKVYLCNEVSKLRELAEVSCEDFVFPWTKTLTQSCLLLCQGVLMHWLKQLFQFHPKIQEVIKPQLFYYLSRILYPLYCDWLISHWYFLSNKNSCA